MANRHDQSTVQSQAHAEWSDLDLAGLARESPEAFGDLYERYLDGIFRYCLRRVGSPQAAEDLTAGVFERALAGIGTFKGGSFRAWIFRIAHNAVTDHYRRRRDQVPWSPEMSGADDDPSPEDQVIAREQRARITAFLDLLTNDQREVVELRLSGLTGVEIAEATDRTPDVVKMLQHRALKRMRSQITSEQADAETSDA